MNKMLGSRKRGLMQSLDFSIAFLLMLVIVLVFAMYTFTELKRSEKRIDDFQKARLSVMLLDGLLKRNANSEMGLALFDASKRRVQENRLETGKKNSWQEYGLRGLRVECGSAVVVFVPEKEGKECRVLSRLAYLNGEKCLLKARFCD